MLPRSHITKEVICILAIVVIQVCTSNLLKSRLIEFLELVLWRACPHVASIVYASLRHHGLAQQYVRLSFCER